MKKFFRVFICCMFLFPLFAIASEQSIYFCTKDLDAMGSFSVENKNNFGFSNFVVYKDLNNPYNTKLRHCFMAYATKTGEDEKNLYLKVEDARSYGSPDYTLRAKAGGVYSEPSIAGATVSCVSVFEKIDMFGVEKKVFDIWLEAYRSMYDEATKLEYDTISHNCCTVAYKAVTDIRGHLERIDAINFNLYGMGIVWGQTFYSITGFSSSSSSLYPSVVETSKRMFSSSSPSSSSLSPSSSSRKDNDKSGLSADRIPQADVEKVPVGSKIPVDKNSEDGTKDDL